MFRRFVNHICTVAASLTHTGSLASYSTTIRGQGGSTTNGSLLSKAMSVFNPLDRLSSRGMASLEQMHKTGPHIKKRPPRQPLDGAPLKKGVVLKTLIKKPKKPNSANRKCVLVRLSTGKEMVAYVPGEGHNLQEHNIVLVRCGRVQDLPGVKLKCVRGVYDLGHVVKKK